MNIKRLYKHIWSNNLEYAAQHGNIDEYGCFDEDDDYSPAIVINGGVGVEDISRAERVFGFSFCEDYREFLLNFGSIVRLPGDLYSGILAERHRAPGYLPGGALYSETQIFFTNIYEGPELESATLFLNEQDEWYVIIDHSKGLATPYDPFAKNLVYDQSLSLEAFLLESL